VGAGTILTPADVAASVAAGARFLVSPGSTPALLDAMLDSGAAALPAAATASEVINLMERGLDHGKYFPAKPAGGVAYPSPRNPQAGSPTSRRSRDRCRTSDFVPPVASTCPAPRTSSPYPTLPASAAPGSARTTRSPGATGAGSRPLPGRRRVSAPPERLKPPRRPGGERCSPATARR